MMRIATTLLLAFALLPTGLHAAAIRVWEHYDFGGNEGVFDRSVSAISSTGWNDRISSLRVESGQWEVCRDNDYRNCQVLSQGTQLSRLDGGWNDTISSVRPVSSSTVGTDPQMVANRLYRAILGRDADPEGLRNAAAQIQSGRVSELVGNLTSSQEFRTLAQQRSSTEILDQIYRGLFGRGSDSAARTAYLPRIERGEVSAVVLDLLSSDELGGSGSVNAPAAPAEASGENYRTRGQGNGSVTWGRSRAQAIRGAKIALGADGRVHINLAGSTPENLYGTYVNEGNGTVTIRTVELDGRSIPASGTITFTNKEWLQNIDLTAGTPGTRDHVALNFKAVR